MVLWTRIMSRILSSLAWRGDFNRFRLPVLSQWKSARLQALIGREEDPANYPLSLASFTIIA